MYVTSASRLLQRNLNIYSSGRRDLKSRSRDTLGVCVRESGFLGLALVLAGTCLLIAINASAQTVTQRSRRPTRRLVSDPTVANIVADLRGLPFAEFLDQSYRQLRLRDPDALIYNGFDDGYELQYDHLSDLSDRYLRQTQELEAAILALLHGYRRVCLTTDQQISYDVYEWYLDNLVRGHRFSRHEMPVNGYGSWDLVNTAATRGEQLNSRRPKSGNPAGSPSDYRVVVAGATA
jgi:hypothetical protein